MSNKIVRSQEERDLETVMENGLTLEDVEVQTPAICLAAVTEDGYALKYVIDQTPEIIAAALAQNPKAKKYIKVIVSRSEYEESLRLFLSTVYGVKISSLSWDSRKSHTYIV